MNPTKPINPNELRGVKITQLPQIQKIDGDDILLISDYESGKCYTRRMSIEQLLTKVLATIISNPTLLSTIQQIATQAGTEAGTEAAERAVEKLSEDIIMQTVEKNIDIIEDLFDGKRDDQYIIDTNND